MHLEKRVGCLEPQVKALISQQRVCELSPWHRSEAGETFAEAKGMARGKLRGLLTDVISHKRPFICMMNVRRGLLNP